MPTSELINALNPYAIQQPGISHYPNHWNPIQQQQHQHQYVQHRSELELAMAEQQQMHTMQHFPPITQPPQISNEYLRVLEETRREQEAERARRRQWEQEQEAMYIKRQAEMERQMRVMHEEIMLLREANTRVQPQANPEPYLEPPPMLEQAHFGGQYFQNQQMLAAQNSMPVFQQQQQFVPPISPVSLPSSQSQEQHPIFTDNTPLYEPQYLVQQQQQQQQQVQRHQQQQIHQQQHQMHQHQSQDHPLHQQKQFQQQHYIAMPNPPSHMMSPMEHPPNGTVPVLPPPIRPPQQSHNRPGPMSISIPTQYTPPTLSVETPAIFHNSTPITHAPQPTAIPVEPDSSSASTSSLSANRKRKRSGPSPTPDLTDGGENDTDEWNLDSWHKFEDEDSSTSDGEYTGTPKRRVNRKNNHDTRILSVSHAMRLHILRLMGVNNDLHLPPSHPNEETPLPATSPVRFIWDKTPRKSLHNTQMRTRVIADLRANHKRFYKHVPEEEFRKLKPLEKVFDQAFTTFRHKYRNLVEKEQAGEKKRAVVGSQIKVKKSSGSMSERKKRKNIKMSERNAARTTFAARFQHPIFDAAFQLGCLSSDESDSGDDSSVSFRSRPLPWRSSRLEKLYLALDEATPSPTSSSSHMTRSHDKNKKTGNRVRGPPKAGDDVLPPAGIRRWMVKRKWLEEGGRRDRVVLAPDSEEDRVLGWDRVVSVLGEGSDDEGDNNMGHELGQPQPYVPLIGSSSLHNALSGL